MTDRGSEPKAPLRPMAPPFGGLRASRPLTRPSGTPSLGATPIAQRAVTPLSAPVTAPPRSATPFSTPTLDPAAPATHRSELAPSLAAPPTESYGDAAPMPGIADFMSSAEPEASTADDPSVPRFAESELAKSTHGDPLFERTVPAVPETVAADQGAFVIDDELDAATELPRGEPASFVDPRDVLADAGLNTEPPRFDAEPPAYEPRVASIGTPSSMPAWNDDPWPATTTDEPAVSARPTPHDVAALHADDDPFHWDSPNSFAPSTTEAAPRGGADLVAADGGSNPFAALSEPPFAASASAHGDAEEVERPVALPRMHSEFASDQRDEEPGTDAAAFGGGPSTVYEPDDATSWAATATPGQGAGVVAEGAGRHAAAVLEHLAEDVRSGRLRIDGGENASAAGVLASLLATLLAPQRPG